MRSLTCAPLGFSGSGMPVFKLRVCHRVLTPWQTGLMAASHLSMHSLHSARGMWSRALLLGLHQELWFHHASCSSRALLWYHCVMCAVSMLGCYDFCIECPKSVWTAFYYAHENIVFCNHAGLHSAMPFSAQPEPHLLLAKRPAG